MAKVSASPALWSDSRLSSGSGVLTFSAVRRIARDRSAIFVPMRRGGSHGSVIDTLGVDVHVLRSWPSGPALGRATRAWPSCFYPKSVSTFDLGSYLGTWYQVAGYEAVFTAGCKCITANYTLEDDGTVGVKNQCEALGLPISITGSAAPADPVYGVAGAFEVTFFNSTNACPGPNYIVQEYVVDDYAIVQSPDFGTLFVLSRGQNVTESKLEALTTRSVELGSRRSLIKTNPETV